MSDDLLRTARQFLAELQASETHLRASAVMALPYPSVLAAERRASKRCAELLAALGGAAFEVARPAPDDTTDALLRNAVRARDVTTPVNAWRQPEAAPPASLGAASSVGAFTNAPAYEPFEDDGPEGVADERHDLSSESEEIPV